SSRGVRRKEKVTDFLAIEYRGGDRLLVPVQDFRLVQKYVGQEGKKPQLYSLDGEVWEKVKQKVKKEVAELAHELLETAALRKAADKPQGFLSADGAMVEVLQKEFSESFPYEETPDQIAALDDVLNDLDSEHLMDRLVCGDVGYGKTEVAMRAAFKVVCDSKQAAVLVPTTILAEQHYKTFMERFAAFPVKIGMLSRFQRPSEQRKVLHELKKGTVDILIGTHRLLQKDVHFSRLGLLVIDEEHRFGVQQKELLKKMRVDLDILSLSATPIPRTFSLSLGSVKDISIIETAPVGRLPIETKVSLFDEKILRRVVQRELERGGQIFYVHNRVQTIGARKKYLETLFPNLRIGLAHGQMKAETLEKAMWNFLHRKWDLLLSTSIIESGLDIPTVNTLIVEDSEEFGLSQLYQLRGRIGRQREKAYCTLFFSDWHKLSEDARKRLDAIQEFSALGSGMRLAVRDMEIRGAGNILGAQQHGWINSVGLDLYCQLLTEEVERCKREKGFRVAPSKKSEKVLPEIDLNIPSYISEAYVESAGERISLYKKIAGLREPDDLEAFRRECLDLYGPLPSEMENLMEVVRLRLLAWEAGVQSLSESPNGILGRWIVAEKGLPLDLARLARDYPKDIEFFAPQGQNKTLEILYHSDEEQRSDISKTIEEVRKFLQITKHYVTI
ncbi:MAG: transcription-repair coupling factor, partial [Elusimicrobia bacterium]|nr:transcription-repair coupling factor [Elusimicrobiota bacterium]